MKITTHEGSPLGRRMNEFIVLLNLGLFFLIFIHLFILFWLCQVLVAVLGIFVVA